MTYTHSNGSVDTVDSYREKIESGFYVYHRIDHPIDRIVVEGDTALVIGEMHADISSWKVSPSASCVPGRPSGSPAAT